MSKNILINNETCLYHATHYFGINGEALKLTDLRKREEPVGMMSVIFCPKCKKMHPAFKTFQDNGDFIFKEEKYPFSFFENSDNPVLLNWRVDSKYLENMTCPSCGENLSQYKLVTLEKRSVNSNNSRTLKSLKIFDPEDDKLIASVFIAYYYPNTNGGKLAIIPVRHRIVFNYKTGLTYFLQGRTLDGKHPRFDSTPEIFNATLGGEIGCCVEISSIVKNNQIVAALAEELIKVHKGDKTQLTKTGDFSDTNFTMLTIYNNIPYFNYNFYNMASKSLNKMYWGDRKPRDRFTYKLRTLKERYELGDPEVFKKYLFKGTKLEIKKSIRRELFANPFLADYYKLIVKSGFKNHDIIRQFLRDGLEFLMSYKNTYDEEDNDYRKCMVDFIKALIKAKGEVGACKTLMTINRSDNGRYLKDTALMYAVFKKRKMFKPEYFKGDLGKIHDTLAKDYKKIKEPNVKLKYSEEMFDLNDKINDFVFELAQDTYELIDIGQEMHICVGSYGQRAAGGHLIIVKMMQGNQYVGCLELSKNGKELKQAKACFNNRLEERKAEALKAWVEKHKIEARYCYDYTHIANDEISYDEDKIYQGHTDYSNYYMGNIEREARRILAEDVEDMVDRNLFEDDEDIFPFA